MSFFSHDIHTVLNISDFPEVVTYRAYGFVGMAGRGRGGRLPWLPPTTWRPFDDAEILQEKRKQAILSVHFHYTIQTDIIPQLEDGGTLMLTLARYELLLILITPTVIRYNIIPHVKSRQSIAFVIQALPDL